MERRASTDTFARLNHPTALEARLARRYGELLADELFAEFVAGSGYGNCGYWADGTVRAAEACEALVDRLLAHLPAAARNVLDAGCGAGAPALRIAARTGARVVAIDRFTPLLAAAKRRGVPRLLCMDAARLGLADASFDAVVCIESAFQFVTRERFLREAWRVLVPGGTLLLADLLTRATAGQAPRENVLSDPAELRALLERCGFEVTWFEDASARGWKAFRSRYARFVLARLWRPRVLARLPRLIGLALTRLPAVERAVTGYVLVAARVRLT